MSPRLTEWLWGLLACVLGAAGGFATANAADLPAGWGAIIAAILAALADAARHWYSESQDIPLSPPK